MIHPPDDYLGTKIKLTTLPNGKKAWGHSISHYVREAVKNVESWMSKEGYHFSKRAETPMSSSYRPELDVSQELDSEKANYYQSVIGVLRWIIETGRLDITTEVSMLAAHMAAPREGHLKAALQVFAYLKKKLSCIFRTKFRFLPIRISYFGNSDRKASSGPEAICLAVSPK